MILNILNLCEIYMEDYQYAGTEIFEEGLDSFQK